MAPGLRRLAARRGGRPRLASTWPCHQLDDAASPSFAAQLGCYARALSGVDEVPAPLKAAGRAFALDGAHAMGQPEAFVFAPVWLIVRPDGSLHLALRPKWAQKVAAKGWGTVHPFARYMAGAVPPQSLIIYAPRDESELAIAIRIIAAAHCYATGRIGEVALPDSRW
ncbi:luciferase family protein [Bradyrhizobium sp. SRS-191]|uniref:luciferase domain-containing protein n=1 Tax=Bradyrhizobium sp. SRS-191 TaxID=2962606 RepID=UPI00211E4D94|nr:luciferase family protein [Bradyrhizobium sp. SRS-191]